LQKKNNQNINNNDHNHEKWKNTLKFYLSFLFWNKKMSKELIEKIRKKESVIKKRYKFASDERGINQK
jgi:hypothetical protein